MLRDAGIPDRPSPADMGLVVMEPEMPPLPRDRPRLRPRLLEVCGGPGSPRGWEFEDSSPCVMTLGGEEAEGTGWLLFEEVELVRGAEEEEEVMEFLACCCADGWGACWVALL